MNQAALFFACLIGAALIYVSSCATPQWMVGTASTTADDSQSIITCPGKFEVK